MLPATLRQAVECSVISYPQQHSRKLLVLTPLPTITLSSGPLWSSPALPRRSRVQWDPKAEGNYRKGLPRQVRGPAPLTPTLAHSLCTFRALRDFLGAVALGASRPVPLRFLTCLGDLLPSGLDSGAATLVKAAQGKPGVATSPLYRKAGGSSQLGTASALWMARAHGSWSRLPRPYQACTPTERCRQKAELAFPLKVTQRHGEL